MAKMNRSKAIEYLERKGKLDEPTITKERKFTQFEEKKIKQVMREGKIYGDPMVVLNE